MTGPRELVVGCFTAGDYAREAEDRLLKSLRGLGLAHEVREVPNQGSWILNNAICQVYLLGLDGEMPDTDFIYCDVDGVFHSSPWPFMRTLKPCDVAAHYLDGNELLSGTLYLPAFPRRGELLRRWIDRNKAMPDVWDQKHLQTLLAEDPTFVVKRLPPEYCCIFDTHRHKYPGIVPVIEHFQASRRLKHRVRPE